MKSEEKLKLIKALIFDMTEEELSAMNKMIFEMYRANCDQDTPSWDELIETASNRLRIAKDKPN